MTTHLTRWGAAAGAVLLGVTLAGCGSSDDKPAASAKKSATASAPVSHDDSSDAASPADDASSAGPLDACTVVNADAIEKAFGVAPEAAGMVEDSSFGDPNAKDCLYFTDTYTIAVQATSRADSDMKPDEYNGDQLEDSVAIPDADRGWAYVFPGQDGADSVVSQLDVIKDGFGMNMSITVNGHPYTTDNLLTLAASVIEGLPK